jgi:hypothetical protein
MKNCGGEKRSGESEAGQKFLPPQPPSFLPVQAFSLAREARRQFCSKKVRISSNKRTPFQISQHCLLRFKYFKALWVFLMRYTVL